MLRRIVLGAVTNLLRREVMRGAQDGIMAWLNPCRRLTLARVMYEFRTRRGHTVRAAWWHWRVDVLERKCDELREGGLCATDIAKRAAVEAITEAIAKGVWPK